MKYTMKQLSFLFVMCALSTFISACNTMEGLGEDIQQGGQKLESSASENKDY